MNVSRVHRLLKLITLLRCGRPMNAEALAAALAVSRRTLFRDLKLLEHAGVPYRFEHANDTYVIADSFFLPSTHLTLEESLSLLLVTRKALSRQLHPMYQQALDACLKIESNIPRPILEYCGQYLDGLSIRWEPGQPATGIAEQFDILQRAIAEHTRLAMKYDSVWDQGRIHIAIDPLRLVFASRAWYLIANSLHHGEIRSFKLARIVDLHPTGERFASPARFSEGAYFGRAWRMIPQGTIYQVRLHFSAEVATSVKEVYWHPTQKVHHLPDGGILFDAEIDGLSEIASWVLSYGKNVRVLAPNDLRELVRQHAIDILRLADAVVQDQ